MVAVPRSFVFDVSEKWLRGYFCITFRADQLPQILFFIAPIWGRFWPISVVGRCLIFRTRFLFFVYFWCLRPLTLISKCWDYGMGSIWPTAYSGRGWGVLAPQPETSLELWPWRLGLRSGKRANKALPTCCYWWRHSAQNCQDCRWRSSEIIS